MTRAILVLALCTTIFTATAQTADASSQVHRSCSWCHMSGGRGIQPVLKHEGDRPGTTQQVSAICISCHDGTTGPALNDVHMVHTGRFPKEPLACLDCHDPHDRTGSYRMLRGTHGPETAQTALLGFCRGCHTDH